MYIKQIIIEGFKTYKELTVLDIFSPTINVIMGKNGSGKSNLLDAIQFVLSDKYSSLRAEDRMKLLHEGAGREVLHATVEIVFDNTDNRFPIDKSEISIKRSIGQKKDEFFLDNRHVSKQDIQNLLESAGLSQSNPYYIVEQGKINRINRMKDEERLDLLKEIAGTRTYDERKIESLKIMKETDAKRIQVTEVIEQLNNNIETLEGQVGELKEFNIFDNQRRAIEYVSYEKQKDKATEELEKLDDERLKASAESASLYKKAQDAQIEKQSLEKDIISIEGQINRLEAERKTVIAAKSLLLEKKSEYELTKKDIESKKNDDEKNRDKYQKELKTIRLSIEKTQKKLSELSNEYDKRLGIENDLKTSIDKIQQRIDLLSGKQSRGSQFRTKKDRDAFLRQQISDQEKNYRGLIEQKEIAEKEKKDNEIDIGKLKTDVEKREKQREQRKKDHDKMNDRIDRLKQERDQVMEQLQTLRQNQRDEEEKLNRAKTSVEQGERDIQLFMDRDSYQAFEFIRRLKEDPDEDNEGIHGAVIDLFNPEVPFYRAVEITAGNALFFIVVDNDAIAAKLMNRLQKEKKGRITFIPLNRISAKEIDYPRRADAIPLVDKLKSSSIMRPLMLKLFSQTVITRDITAAANVANEGKFHGITLNGDRADRKGTISGGFIDRVLKIEKYNELKKARILLSQLIASRSDSQKKEDELTKKSQKLSDDIEKIYQEKILMRSNDERSEIETMDAQKSIHRMELRINEINQDINKINNQIELIRQQIDSLKTEMDTELSAALTTAESNELSSLTTQLSDNNKRLLVVAREKNDSKTERDQQQATLENNLLKRAATLEELLSTRITDEQNDQIERINNELQTIIASLSNKETEVSDIDEKIIKDKQLLKSTQDKIEIQKKIEHDTMASVNREGRSVENSLAKRSAALQKREEAIRQIHELGSLPTDLQKFKNLSSEECLKKLKTISDKLQKYKKVNKKALDQYVAFTEQRQDLFGRKEEAEQGRIAIEELIKTLDNKKEEAIQRTFKSIGKSFSEVFSQLVPGGKASLIIRTKRATDENADDKKKIKKIIKNKNQIND